MITILISYENFLSNFNLKQIDFETFKNTAVTNRHILIKDWLNNFEHSDIRYIKQNEILNILYNFMVTNNEINLKKWYDIHLKIDDINEYIKFDINKDILSDNIINGKVNNLTRINKNIFFKEIYDTPKTWYNTKPTLFQTLKAIFEEYMLPRCWGLPMGIKKILENNISGLYSILRGTEQKASTFNPYTAGYILENIYHANKIFTPTLGWDSYLIGFLNTSAKEYIGVDVIQDVIDKSMELSKYTNKKTKFICCPSEQLDSRYDFSKQYNKYFDSIFFSPPYFNCEQYTDGEQSIKNFPNYNDWLLEYWNNTCKLCKEILSDNGHFGFVVSNYKINGKELKISEDMLNIAQQYFDLNNQYYIGWNSFKASSAKKMQNGNLENFYFMNKK